jgi:chemotaxis family two-component system response regulator Rcp1
MTEDLSRARPAEVLLVDDTDDVAELTRIGFERARLAVRLHHVSDGEECMRFLRREGPYAAAPVPDLILLDLNMPKMDGHEVLEEINRDEALRHLVVVVLTSSKADEDVLRSYKLRCSSYLVRPIDFDSFAQMVRSLSNYWFSLVVLPPRP